MKFKEILSLIHFKFKSSIKSLLDGAQGFVVPPPFEHRHIHTLRKVPPKRTIRYSLYRLHIDILIKSHIYTLV